jgi:hypothetical protein
MTASWLPAVNRQMLPSIFSPFYYLKSACLGSSNLRKSPKQLAKRSIHLVFANFKLWLLNIHHVVSHQHLHAYLNEFTFRFNRRFYPFNGFRSLLGIAGAATAPTYDELYSGEWQHPTGCDRW